MERERGGGNGEREGEWTERRVHVYIVNLSLIRTSGGSKTHPESKCPELLANYCDLLLRKTPLSKKLTSDETDEKLKNVVS